MTNDIHKEKAKRWIDVARIRAAAKTRRSGGRVEEPQPVRSVKIGNAPLFLRKDQMIRLRREKRKGMELSSV